MKKDIKKLLDKGNKLNNELDNVIDSLNELVNDVCEFDAGITLVSGDGFLVILPDTGDTADLGCLLGKTKSNKLTLKEFEEWGV